MKYGVMMLAGLATGLACGTGGAMTADPAANPYQGIVERNVFGLRPPPPPAPPESEKPKEVKIMLTGITTIFGNKRVLMKTPGPPAKPGQPAQGDKYYTLTEGQAEDDIEVLEINPKTGDVKLKNAGSIVTLNLAKDGPKAPSGAAAGAVPGALPGATAPGLPGAVRPAPTTPTSFPMPSRPPRVAGGFQAAPSGGYGAPSAASPSFVSSGSTPAVNSGGMAFSAPNAAGAGNVSVPLNALNQAPAPSSDFKPWPPPQYDLSPDVKAILLEKQRLEWQQSGNPNIGLLPPPIH